MKCSQQFTTKRQILDHAKPSFHAADKIGTVRLLIEKTRGAAQRLNLGDSQEGCLGSVRQCFTRCREEVFVVKEGSPGCLCGSEMKRCVEQLHYLLGCDVAWQTRRAEGDESRDGRVDVIVL